jgi:hypothetical protein
MKSHFGRGQFRGRSAEKLAASSFPSKGKGIFPFNGLFRRKVKHYIMDVKHAGNPASPLPGSEKRTREGQRRKEKSPSTRSGKGGVPGTDHDLARKGGSGMQLELNTVIETEGKEKRLEGNNFVLEKEGYHLYPLNTQVYVYGSKGDEPIGLGTITKLVFEGGKTVITYQLVKLKNTN